MVESRCSRSAFGSTGGKRGKGKKEKLLNTNGQGGNPSSLATKKAGPNKRPPSSNIFAA